MAFRYRGITLVKMLVEFRWLWVLWQKMKLLLRSKRDPIFSGNVHVGTILKVYPKVRSHSKFPYQVRIVETANDYFKTELLHPERHNNPHVRTFKYNSAEWVDYHCDRFRIIKRVGGSTVSS
jgi:hypothetical protein